MARIMAPSRTQAVPETLYRTLVWLDFRLAVVFTLGLPLVLLVWAAWRREGALLRLMGIYWKVASLLAIAVLLFVDARPLAYPLMIVAKLLMVASLWFWVDLNEELADLPPWRPLPLTLRSWRWALTAFGLLGAGLGVGAMGCGLGAAGSTFCQTWLEAPRRLHGVAAQVFSFVFGADLTPTLTAFFGYLALVAYVVGLLQWILVRLPRQGRVAGGF